jgi:hypothetical protein
MTRQILINIDENGQFTAHVKGEIKSKDLVFIYDTLKHNALIKTNTKPTTKN